MHHVMLDLETTGTTPGCGILSIGAAEFSPAPGPDARFHAADISRASCLRAGLVEDRATLAWWANQVDSLILHRCEGENGMPIGDALHQLAFWLMQVSPLAKDLLVYGNGADFDLPILAEAYRRCGLRTPWLPYSGRCYRTLKNLRPTIALERVDKHHNALDNATSQAEHAVRLMNELGGWVRWTSTR